MIGTDSNHWQIVRNSLSGERAVDEQTYASLAILAERLERLKDLDSIFSKVTLSSAVKKLLRQKNAIAVS